ncbi:MAG: O-antigen ligase family protein [Megasphaera micronuciformis]|jgi:O-antigen polymerase superfamily|nr:O-antigen ligase family protein [Megasphaera micronuciformis]
MRNFILQNDEKVVAVLLSLMVCVMHLSVSVGNILYAAAVIVGVGSLYIRRHEKFPARISLFLKAYAIMLVFIIPSALVTVNIKVVGSFFNIWVWKGLTALIILRCIRHKATAVVMLLVLFYFTAADGLYAFYDSLTMAGLEETRSGGFLSGSVMAFAMVMTMLFPIALVFLYDITVPSRLRRAAAILLVALGFGMWGNQSRGSWLFSLINGTILTLMYGIRKKRYLLAAAVIAFGIGGIFTVNPDYESRFLSITNTTTNSSNLGRVYVWNSTLYMIEDKPLFGFGPGQWQTNYRRSYRDKRELQDLGHAHNNFLHIAAESGMIGVLAFSVFWLFVLFHTGRLWLIKRSPYDSALFFAIIAYIFMFGMSDYTWGKSDSIREFWFVMSLLLVMKDGSEKE